MLTNARRLTLATPQGWHAFVPAGPLWRCVACHGHVEHPMLWADLGLLCRGLLVPIPAVTSPPHDPPIPAGRLF